MNAKNNIIAGAPTKSYPIEQWNQELIQARVNSSDARRYLSAIGVKFNMKKLTGTRWRHYKNMNIYCILMEGKSTETGKNQIIYTNLKKDNLLTRWFVKLFLNLLSIFTKEVWIREEKEFFSVATYNNITAPRFRRIDKK